MVSYPRVKEAIEKHYKGGIKKLLVADEGKEPNWEYSPGYQHFALRLHGRQEVKKILHIIASGEWETLEAEEGSAEPVQPDSPPISEEERARRKQDADDLEELLRWAES